jgi:hypothetical protein
MEGYFGIDYIGYFPEAGRSIGRIQIPARTLFPQYCSLVHNAPDTVIGYARLALHRRKNHVQWIQTQDSFS